MSNRVLVLNQDYSPLAVCTVERAFTLVFLKKAELTKKITNRFLRTVSQTYPVPAVVRLNRYINVPYKRNVVLTRNNIFKRDGFKCQYCSSTRDLTLDHVLPRSRGGKSTWKNLITACKRCNAKKGDYTPKEVGMNPMREPFKPSYVIFLRDFSGYTLDEWLPFLQTRDKVEIQ
ncbi:HNH endonuclease [Fulvivirgaceae bacterium BMA10]|uniref:HNH endonuclease n=1 Tax=Splendidivirga corallicola TaxID=3051826 RepID=A0ABT8KIC0_9BACT|nr:HNH endonuclease [Fulvivirgaceae bacterium BMA10]